MRVRSSARVCVCSQASLCMVGAAAAAKRSRIRGTPALLDCYLRGIAVTNTELRYVFSLFLCISGVANARDVVASPAECSRDVSHRGLALRWLVRNLHVGVRCAGPVFYEWIVASQRLAME